MADVTPFAVYQSSVISVSCFLFFVKVCFPYPDVYKRQGFQYAFISLGNKMGMALGTSLLAMVLGMCGYVAGGRQNPAVLAVIKHSFTTIPGMFWIITGIVLFYYRLNRRRYNEIMKEMYTGGA